MAHKETIAYGVDLWLGDCREVLPLLPRVDAVVTDPPYGISAVLGMGGGAKGDGGMWKGVAIDGDAEARQRSQEGPPNRNGSGTPYVLVDKRHGRPFNEIFPPQKALATGT